MCIAAGCINLQFNLKQSLQKTRDKRKKMNSKLFDFFMKYLRNWLSCTHAAV